MKPGFLKKFLLLSAILFLSMACEISSPKTKLLGGVFFTDEGGYEIQKVNDYTFNEFSGGFEMLVPGTLPTVGPGFLVYGGLIDNEQANEELWKFIIEEEFNFYQFEQPKNRRIDDIPGLIAEFHGVQANTRVNGKLFVAMVDKQQQFIMLGVAPEDDWAKFESIYDMVLKTLKFYIPNRNLKLENKFKRDMNENEF